MGGGEMEFIYHCVLQCVVTGEYNFCTDSETGHVTRIRDDVLVVFCCLFSKFFSLVI